ncbi:MAG: aromatic ring-hydroxylating dioxygenase subunit alpha [Myxococcota bacterium]
MTETMNSSDVRPPSFAEARNKRQKVRSAGLDPNHWYAVAQATDLEPGQVIPVTFWGHDVALFRGKSGEYRCIEDRCAHRQLKLSIGQVEGERLVCGYHGWQYDGQGRLVAVEHELFGRKLPKCKLKSYAVRVRYGLVWVFFGDEERSHEVAMPEIPELEGRRPWACIPLSFTCNAHHSMIIDNVSDFTHAYLHRRFRPFWDAKLTKLEEGEDRVRLAYDTMIGGGKLTQHFIDRGSVDTSSIELCYDYPYQWSNTDDHIKHWLSVLPVDERTTKMFFLFYFKSFKVPFLPVRFPHRMMKSILRVANELHIKPLLAEDIVACQAEQIGYEKHFDKPIAELNPAVHAFQALTVRKWEAYLEAEADKRPAEKTIPLRTKAS